MINNNNNYNNNNNNNNNNSNNKNSNTDDENNVQNKDPVMFILQIMFMKTFLVTGLVGQYLFFPKIMCAFIVVSCSTKFDHSTTIVLLSANPKFVCFSASFI